MVHRLLLHIPRSALAALLTQADTEMAEACQRTIVSVVNEAQKLEEQRSANQMALRPCLMHPQNESELKALLENENTRYQRHVALIKGGAKEICSSTSNLLASHRNQIAMAAHHLAALQELVIMPGDLQTPSDEESDAEVGHVGSSHA
jgi:hypothetical protein